MRRTQRPITLFLQSSSGWTLTIYAIFASFCTYFCMYAFRKPFAAAEFAGLTFFGTMISLKSALIIGQVLGYAASKFIGIKICSEVSPHRRARLLVGLILASHAALVLFAIVPNEAKVIALFLSALPLGMVWGLVVWYLEGRQTSEVLLAGLSCSFIVASAAVKDVAIYLMNSPENGGWGISENWMPAATALIFLGPYLLSVWLLNQVPRPTEADENARTAREPMDSKQRLAFMRHFLPAIVMLGVAYFVLTAYRDYRDNFIREILGQLNYDLSDAANRAFLTQVDMLAAFGVLVSLATLSLFKSNRRGLIGAFAIMTIGVTLMASSTFAFDQLWISGFWWMALNGLGVYMFYVPFGSVLFDRMIASTHIVGTAVFAIYLFDAAGYTGVVVTLLFKDQLYHNVSKLEFFHDLTYFMAGLGIAMLVPSCAYLLVRHVRSPEMSSLKPW